MTSTVEPPQLFGFYGDWGSRGEPDALLEYARRRAGSAEPGPRQARAREGCVGASHFEADEVAVAIEGQPLCEGLTRSRCGVNPAAEVAAAAIANSESASSSACMAALRWL